MDKVQRFVALIEEYQRVIYKVCSVYAPDRSRIDDYFQEVVLALWRGFDAFRGESKTATWVYRVAVYNCISFVRRRMRRPQSVGLTVDIKDEEPSETRERIDELYRVIGRLGRLDKALILLWLEERSYEEIAEITGLKANNVAVRLSRIREKLRKMYNR
ncbi:MAG: sigma-70 family RNA polymerase sigma factor [Alistipes sp.]|nr:sigma-70 family RNA polymerase sigma factor [Alistipes sp.]